jgi:hypothetical protein
VKEINFERHLDDLNQEDIDFASLATDIAILSVTRVRQFPQVASLISVGWESSTYDALHPTNGNLN